MSASNKQVLRKEVLEPMPQNIQDSFFELLRIQSSSSNEKRMVVYITNQLKKMALNWTIDSVGNILVTKGTSLKYPCIVSHMDTVHKIYSEDLTLQVLENKNRTVVEAYVKKKRAGVGGDDKCGIFACLLMLNNVENIKAVFFTQEEVGCVGSTSVDYAFFKDVGHILQLDRYGRGDFICQTWAGNTVSKKYLEKVSPLMLQYGYSQKEGLITDSINLWENGIGISAVNISCGYYLHHTEEEFIDLNEFWNSLKLTKVLIDTLGENFYPSTPERTSTVRSEDWAEYPYLSSYQDEEQTYSEYYQDEDHDILFDVISDIYYAFGVENVFTVNLEVQKLMLDEFNYIIEEDFTLEEFRQLAARFEKMYSL